MDLYINPKLVALKDFLQADFNGKINFKNPNQYENRINNTGPKNRPVRLFRDFSSGTSNFVAIHSTCKDIPCNGAGHV